MGRGERLVRREEERFVCGLIYFLKVILHNKSNVTVVYCCVTNRPEIQWLKTAIDFYVFMILWLAWQLDWVISVKHACSPVLDPKMVSITCLAP